MRTFTVVTSAADEVARTAHDRMPVVLRREDEGVWLDARAPAAALERLLTPRSVGLSAAEEARAESAFGPGLFDALATP